MFKLMAMLICIGLGVLLLAQLYGVDPSDLNVQSIQSLIQRAFSDIRNEIVKIVEQMKNAAQRV